MGEVRTPHHGRACMSLNQPNQMLIDIEHAIDDDSHGLLLCILAVANFPRLQSGSRNWALCSQNDGAILFAVD